MSDSVAAAPNNGKKKWVRWLLIAGGAFTLLIVLGVLGLMMYFNDAYFKARMQEAIKSGLGRESEIGNVSVSLFSGNVTVEKFKLLNASEKFAEKETLRFDRLTAHVDVWPLITSSAKKISGAKVSLEKPELIIQARGVYPVEELNIADIIKKLTSGPKGTWPKDTGLQALDFDVAIRDGLISYQDSDKHLGQSRIEKLDLTARMPGLGQPTETKAKLALVTPSTPSGGTAQIDGKILWIDSAGKIDPAAFKDVVFTSTVEDFDVPHVTRHLRMEAELNDGELKVSLGKPASGTVKFEAANFARTKLSVDLETDGAISIWRDDQRVAGNLPSRTVIDAQGGWANGGFVNGPVRYDMLVASNRADLRNESAPKLLELQLDSSTGDDKAGGDKHVVIFKSRMDELFNTDVGAVLNLKDQIGGKIDGKIEAVSAPGGHFKAEGTLKTSQGYVRFQDIKQPTAMDIEFSAKAVPNKFGSPDAAEVNFSAKANSFQVHSLQPVTINSITTPQNLSALAKLQLHVDGREFWKQFGPLLKVFNMSTPLEEELDGELVVGGSTGKINLSLNSTLKNQKTTPAPIKLIAKADYDGSQLVDVPTKPFSNFAFTLKSAADNTLELQMEGNATRGKTQQVVDLPVFKASGDLTGLNNLNARFGAYVRVFLGPEYTVSGNIVQSGNSKFIQNLAADGSEISRELTFATEMKLSNFKLGGPNKWTDKEVALQLGMNLKQGGGVTKLVLQPLKLTSEALTITGELAEADVGKLTTAAEAKPASIEKWIAALPQSKIDVQVSANGIKQLQANGIIMNEPLIAGELAMTGEYNAQTRHAAISNLTFNGPAAKLRSTAQDVDVAALAPLLDTQNASLVKYVRALPGVTLDAQVSSAAISRMQELKFIPTEPLAVGDLLLKTSYDAKENKAYINKLLFNGPLMQLSLTTTDSNVVAAAEAGDSPVGGTSKFLPALPDMAVQAAFTAGAIENLQSRGLVPNDAALKGEIKLNGSYERKSQQLKVEALTFNGAGADCTVSSTGINLAKLTAFLDLPANQQNLNAMIQQLPDLQLDLDARSPLFAFLVKQKLMPFDPNVDGQLILKAHYQNAADVLAIETFRFKKTSASNGPIADLDMALSASNLRKLPATLDALNVPGANAAPAILAHLDKGLTINNLVIAPQELIGFLRRQSVATEFMDAALAGVYAMKQPLTIQNLQLKPSGAGMVDATFTARTPMEWYPPVAPAKTPGPARALAVGGAYRFDADAPLKLNLNTGQFYASGALVLDDCSVECNAAQPFFPYSKAAGVPSKLAFSFSQGNDAVLRVAALALNGGPLGFTMTNLAYNTAAPQPVLSLDKLAIHEGPLAATLSNVQLDMAKDKLKAEFMCDALNLAQFIAPDKSAPNFKVTGNVAGLQLSYDGPLSALTSGTGAATSKIVMRCNRIDANFAGNAPGQNVLLNVQGDINTDGSRITSKGIRMMLNYAPAGKPAVVHNLQLVPDVAPKTAGEPLLSALNQPGLPLIVRLQGGADGDINVDVLTEAFNALASAASPGAKPQSTGTQDYSSISKLRFEFKFDGKAGQTLSAGTLVLRDLRIASLVLDNLKADMVGVSAGIYTDGAANIKRATYDLARQAFSSDFEIANVDLHPLTGGSKGKTKDDYQVFGRLWSSGSMAGAGFEGAARKSWDGNIKSRVADLTAIKNEGKESGFNLTKTGTKLGTTIGGIFLEGRGLGGVARKIDWATAIYTEDFGLFLNKMEFEPLELNVAVEKGIANISRSTLIGKGRSLGLQLDFAGSINLATESYAPQLVVWLRKLPPATQKVLRLDQIDEADRNRILAIFDAGKFQPIVLSGPISAHKTNSFEIANAFGKLDDEVQRLIEEKKAREAAAKTGTTTKTDTTTQPGTTTDTTPKTNTTTSNTNPPPDKPKEKKIGVEDILDIFKKKETK